MNEPSFRRYLPVTIAAVIILALIVLAYFAGYRAGRSAGLRAHRTGTAVRR